MGLAVVLPPLVAEPLAENHWEAKWVTAVEPTRFARDGGESFSSSIGLDVTNS